MTLSMGTLGGVPAVVVHCADVLHAMGQPGTPPQLLWGFLGQQHAAVASLPPTCPLSDVSNSTTSRPMTMPCKQILCSHTHMHALSTLLPPANCLRISTTCCPGTVPHPHGRALGDLDFKRVARGITNEPSVVRHTLRPGADLALVTVSDGVTDVLSDADIGRLVVRVVRKVGERLAGEGAGGWSSGSWWT